ncbi:MAG: TonB-dependent receptor [Gemmatimonadaceae bacterium]|nr:TonB-dependent receptor [Gemmatimonadaceae bacterium]
MALALAITMASALLAQSSDTARLTPVVVSATKTPASRASLTQSVTVLSGDDLRARGITRVTDALREIPGAAIVQNGSFGSVSTLFLRGGESRYTKVLIDGVAVNAPGGFFDLSHLTTDNVDRIEVVRGPASVVYGADAVTGIVQIFTRQGSGPASFTAEARAGTYGARDAGLTLGGAYGRARYSVAGGHHATDGLFSFNNQYYNGTLSGSASYAFVSGAAAGLSGRYTTAEYHYPTDFTGAPVDSNAYRVQHRLTVGFDGSAQLTKGVTARALLGSNEVTDLTEDIAVPFGSTTERHSALTSRSYRRSAEGRLLFALPASASLNVGAEYMRERESSTNAEGPVGGVAAPISTFVAERSNRAAYAELLGALVSRASYTLAGRLDDNSDYERFATYRAGVSVSVLAATRFRASVSTAFNAPAFNQLRPTLYTTGSPGLAPERTRSFEIGMEQSLLAGAAKITANYFNQRFSDLIQYLPGGPPNFLGGYANLTGAQSNGYDVELEVAPISGFSATAGYTHATPRVTALSEAYSGDLRVGQSLIRRPTHSGNTTVRYGRSGIGFLSATASYIGRRPDLDFNQFPSPTVTLPAYTKLDVAGSVDIIRSKPRRSRRSVLALTARFENALDAEYEDALHFAAPGRIVLIGARFTGGL